MVLIWWMPLTHVTSLLSLSTWKIEIFLRSIKKCSFNLSDPNRHSCGGPTVFVCWEERVMVSVFPGAAQLMKNQCLSNPASLATQGIHQDMRIPLFTPPSISHPPSSGAAESPLVPLVILQPNHLALFCFNPPQITTKPQEMVWALWSSVWRWNFWRVVTHPFNYHEKKVVHLLL